MVSTLFSSMFALRPCPSASDYVFSNALHSVCKFVIMLDKGSCCKNLPLLADAYTIITINNNTIITIVTTIVTTITTDNIIIQLYETAKIYVYVCEHFLECPTHWIREKKKPFVSIVGRCLGFLGEKNLAINFNSRLHSGWEPVWKHNSCNQSFWKNNKNWAFLLW